MTSPKYAIWVGVAIPLLLLGCARQYNDFGKSTSDGHLLDAKDVTVTEVTIDQRHQDQPAEVADTKSDGKTDAAADLTIDLGTDVDLYSPDVDAVSLPDTDISQPMDLLDAEDAPDLAQDTGATDIPVDELDETSSIDVTEVVEDVPSVDIPDPLCGDESCTGDETCLSCQVDCGECPFCGDDTCEEYENCDGCPDDCGCPEGEVCYQLDCCTPDCVGKVCGDDGCGDSCGSCLDGDFCEAGKCSGTEMVQVPAGAFWMGCNAELDAECDGDESPPHQVEVGGFMIDITQVSVLAYTPCATDGPCTPPEIGTPSCTWGVEGKEDHPMNCITWEEASTYCTWAEKRLCTEAEWEKAARGACALYGGTCADMMPKYPWGDAALSCAYANYYQGDAGCGTGSTLPVDAQLLGNSPYGTLQMVGNLWDWVKDCYHPSYDQAPTNGSAWETSCAPGFSLRGGSYWSGPASLRCSSRHPGDVNGGFSTHTAGIRCCKSL